MKVVTCPQLRREGARSPLVVTPGFAYRLQLLQPLQPILFVCNTQDRGLWGLCNGRDVVTGHRPTRTLPVPDRVCGEVGA